MARCDKITAQFVGPFEQGIPFYVGIAEHTRIWRAAGEVFVHKVVYDIITKFFSDIDDKMVESFFNSDLARIVDAVQTAAAGFLPISSACGIIPGFHRDTHDFIPLFLEDHGGDGGVYSTAHCY